MFEPRYRITSRVASALVRAEAAREAVSRLPVSARVMARLRETARLTSTHYSTAIEGNRLTLEQAEQVIQNSERFPGRERDEREVRGYYEALGEVEKIAALGRPLAERDIQRIHALVMASGKKRVRKTPYRDGQNVIRDGLTGAIVYLPPEARDVPLLMGELVRWLAEDDELPRPLKAALAHYQLATIHPYYDGNGRTARLVTTLVLHLGGYDLKGIYSLEEYYGRDLPGYYRAIAVGPSHNYYMGRAEADLTTWVEYFCVGMAEAFESVRVRAEEASRVGEKDSARLLRTLDARQRRVLRLFQKSETIAATAVAPALGLSPRTARALCQAWAHAGFLVVIDPARKTRKYGLAEAFRALAP